MCRLVPFVLVLGIWGCGSGQSRTPPPPPLVDLAQGPPDLVVLALDTVRADHLGCYGNDEVQTPNLDRFAQESVLFEDCGSTSTWTLPAFASFFTGRLPVEHGAIGGPHKKLGRELLTLAEILQARDYRTTAFVAVDYLDESFGLNRGFDEQVAHVSGPVTGRFRSYARRVFSRIAAPPPNKSWFLMVHWFDAHDPYRPPSPYDRMYYEGDPEQEPEDPSRSIDVIYQPSNRVSQDPERRYRWLSGIRDLHFPMKQYAAGITHVDAEVGAVLDSLRAHGRLDRSIVVVMADHGEHLTEHDIYFTHKLPYVECLHVPLMIRLPGAAQGGRRVSDPVSLVDVLPTLLELMGLPREQPTDGSSLVGAMRGEALPARPLFAEYGGRPHNRAKAVWDHRYRYVEYSMQGRRWSELYDRRGDPGEIENLAGTLPVVEERLRAWLDTRFGPERRLVVEEAPADSVLDPETEARLRSLGYID